ncbi:MAG: ribosome silencing factor [Desulfotalea sp.]
MKLIKKEFRDKSGEELSNLLAQAALDQKAEDVVIIDVRGMTSYTDYFVVMSGRSTRHVIGLAETLEATVRSKRVKASNAEGLAEGMWVLLDFDDVVVHIFYYDQREFYDLEGLWNEAPQTKLG